AELTTGALGGLTAATIGLTGPLIALAVVTGATVLSMRALYERARRQAQELSPYNAALAAAQARSQVAELRQQIRSAQFLGRDLARLTDAQTRMSVATTRLLDTAEKIFLSGALPAVEL